MMTNRRVLVTFGSKYGGTAEIATAIAEVLRHHGYSVDCVDAARALDVTPYAGVIVGGGLYAGRWHHDARRFVDRFAPELRARPVWMFSSGPLDDSANDREVPPPRSVERLMRRVGARGHATFGGRLASDAKGFMAAAIAKKHAGDWRDWARIDNWALGAARDLEAHPDVDHAIVIPQRRWPLAVLCLAVGVTAIAGGLALLARPDGSLLQMTPAALEHSPFANFSIPGVLLLTVIGAGMLLAGTLILRRSPIANSVTIVAGSALFVWIVVEVLLMRIAHPLQVAYLLVAVAIIVSALRRRVDDRPPATA